MNVLLDTHALIWFITDDRKLTHYAKQIIQDPINTCFVSVASLWEIGIKTSLGRLELKSDLKKIFGLIEQSGLLLLPITPNHILTNAELDFHHRDPFDRLIIAQGKCEELTIISKDKVFEKYHIDLVWNE